ncbi:MAG: photosystem II stability/assembly factor-like uncharacterized protein [Parasphingorhabdus sp.]|jgi:photosystem II stability/assembly factor-like uncharacterized protein
MQKIAPIISLVVISISLVACLQEQDPLPVETKILDDRVMPVDYKLGIFSLNPATKTVYGARGVELYRINENGDQITLVNRFSDKINAIHFASSGLYVATDNNHWEAEKPCRIYRSVDGGQSFKQIWTMQDSSVLWWSITSNSKGDVFLGEYGPRDIGISKRVWRSTNEGETWQVVFQADNNDRLHIHRVIVDPFTDDIWITVGDGSKNRGAFVSRDGADSWQRLLDTQATSIIFTSNAVYFGEDHRKYGRVSRYDRDSGQYEEVFQAADFGNYGGSVYDLGLGDGGNVYVPTMKYDNQDHIASLWTGRGDKWKLLLRLESHAGKATGLSTIAGPDSSGLMYVTGYKIRDN